MPTSPTYVEFKLTCEKHIEVFYQWRLLLSQMSLEESLILNISPHHGDYNYDFGIYCGSIHEKQKLT
jgi:hypothetical protein